MSDGRGLASGAESSRCRGGQPQRRSGGSVGRSWLRLVGGKMREAPGCCWGLAWALDTRTLGCDGSTGYKAQGV